MWPVFCNLHYTFKKFMHPRPVPYHPVLLRFFSLLMLLLLWLWVCSPVVYAVQQDSATAFAHAPADGDDNPPLSGTNGEQAAAGIFDGPPYLSETLLTASLFRSLLFCFQPHATETLLVFHPDLLSPPPEGASC